MGHKNHTYPDSFFERTPSQARADARAHVRRETAEGNAADPWLIDYDSEAGETVDDAAARADARKAAHAATRKG